MSIVITSWLFLLIALIFTLVLTAAYYVKNKADQDLKVIICKGLFFLYVGIVISFTLLPIRIPGEIPCEFEYNLNPLSLVYIFYNRGLLVSAAENALLFMPISILGCFAEMKSFRSIKTCLLTTLSFSVIIELIQGVEAYFEIAEGTMPIMDITDVILNTVGGVMGFLLFKFYRKQHNNLEAD